MAGNSLIVLCVVAFHRGVFRFAQRDPPTWLHGTIALLTVVAAVSLSREDHVVVRLAIFQTFIGVLTMHAAWLVSTQLAPEFGRSAARWSTVPLWVMSVIQLGRVMGLVVAPDEFGAPVWRAQGNALIVVAGMMLSGFVINFATFALLVLRIIKKLEVLTRQGGLTGLNNRRAIDVALKSACGHQRRRKGGDFALLVLDIDHFKQINDVHGHPVGDAVLQQLARALTEASRNGDTVARVGGEEFWLLAPQIDQAGALALAERVRSHVAFATFNGGQPGAGLKVTISIGVAMCSRANDTPEGIVERADQALYLAKTLGRNRVQLAEAFDAGSDSSSESSRHSDVRASYIG